MEVSQPGHGRKLSYSGSIPVQDPKTPQPDLLLSGEAFRIFEKARPIENQLWLVVSWLGVVKRARVENIISQHGLIPVGLMDRRCSAVCLPLHVALPIFISTSQGGIVYANLFHYFVVLSPSQLLLLPDLVVYRMRQCIRQTLIYDFKDVSIQPMQYVVQKLIFYKFVTSLQHATYNFLLSDIL